jgi:endo-1,4-beta-xylanase
MIDYDHGDPNSADPIAKVSSRPDFAVLVYAGWANGTMDTSKIPNDVPPAFMTVAADDKFHADQTLDFYEAVYDKIYEVNKNAKFLPELHVYSHGGHANSISPRNGIPFGTWQFRFQEWLADLDKQNAAAAAPAAKAGQ